MSGDHNHSHGETSGPRFVASLILTLAFVIGEAVAGFGGKSLALLSDAGHNASDALALGLAAYAIWIAKRPASKTKTYGYHRVAILTALFNAASLIVIAVFILIEAWNTFQNPAPVSANLMIWVAAISVVMNTVIAWALSSHAKESLNARAAFIHMAGDAASAAAVIVAGVVVKLTGWVYADPAVAVLIALFILYTGWGIVREATNILLEAAPKGLEIDQMVAAMLTVPLVITVHDVHVWTVSDGMNYLSCHVELPTGSSIEDSSRVVQQLSELLDHDFNIAHATIQTEVEGMCHKNGKEPTMLCADTAGHHTH